MSSSSSKGNRKRKLPKSFLDCPSLSLVVDFPSPTSPQEVISTPVVSETNAAILFERFTKEIVKPFRTIPENKGGTLLVMSSSGGLKKVPQAGTAKAKPSTKNDIWSKRVAVGTNQCLRILEHCMNDGCSQDDPTTTTPQLILLAKDVYPPTMLVHVPAMAKRLNIPLLLLPGKASSDLGQVIGIRKASIILFLAPSSPPSPDDSKIDSFIEFVRSTMINSKPHTK